MADPVLPVEPLSGDGSLTSLLPEHLRLSSSDLLRVSHDHLKPNPAALPSVPMDQQVMAAMDKAGVSTDGGAFLRVATMDKGAVKDGSLYVGGADFVAETVAPGAHGGNLKEEGGMVKIQLTAKSVFGM